MNSDLITTRHLDRKAVVYVRQSSPHQVISNQESLRLQYALSQRARDLGWHDADINVIDADLGMSGAAATHRRGFKELVARVTLGEVGLILSIEVTRLARNCSDWYPLLDVCGHRGCLIADRDGIYDPGTPNGRLLLGLKGTISELELHTIRGRLTAGLIAKAERGELAQPLPAGFVRDPSGVVTKDPDQEVQDRIALVFESFLSLRTAVQATRALCGGNLSLPRRNQHGEVSWKRPTIPAVTDVLKNPAYAGAFVYGRKRLQPVGPSGRPQKTPRPMPEWRIVVKDKYPAYVSWETFERVQAILRDNRSDYLRVKGRGVPRDGAALLHGITWCGECGHKMVVRYKGGSQYVCNHLRQQHDVPECQCLRAAPIDREVAAAFLEAVAPAEIEALARARKMRHRADESLCHAQEQQVQRLRYQASLAERQFNRVDPDNRLVAAELERRWEAALLELRQAEEALRRQAAASLPEPLGIDPRFRAKVVALGARLPAIWADPATPREHRKALLRCLVDKVVMRRSGRDRAEVRIVWRGGITTELAVMMPVNALAALPRQDEMERRVCELAAKGIYDDEIARILTAEGHRSPRCIDAVLPSTVQGIRLRHRIKTTRQRTRWPKLEGRLSVTELAARLRIPPKWIYTQLRRGNLLTLNDPAGRYLFPDDEAAMHAMRKLRAHHIHQVDLREDQPQQEGYCYG
jgi:DNA invertase Pin-like site-specific DNA recombinase